MISEQDLKNLEGVSLDEKITRIETLLLEREKNGLTVRAFELGMLLALKMAEEMRAGLELGSKSSYTVVAWKDKYPSSVIEETIVLAKEFLLNPHALAAKIKDSILEQTKKSEK